MKHFNFTILILSLTGTCFAQLPVRNIHADMDKIASKKNMVFNECIGAGRANEGLRADWQEQLKLAKKEIGFRYIRFHGLLHDDMRVYMEDSTGTPSYNWQYIDKLFDFLLSIDVKPFVEFGFMPHALASGTKEIFWWKANVSKPKSYPKWDSLISSLVMHWQERYGQREVSSWYFEVWNEPDLRGFFDGTQADYFELYAHTTAAVKKVSAAYRVGGPATSATKWIADFLAHCDSAKLPVDFVSTHDYGTTSVLDEFGTKKQRLKSTVDTISLNVKRVRALIDHSAYSNAELHFTEWNTSPSSRDPIHDSYQNAAYLLNALKKIGSSANSMSYWTFTDIFEEAGPGPTMFHGGFGLLNSQGIPKPTFRAYQFLQQLGKDELVNDDPSSYVNKTGNNVQALVWNYTYPDTSYRFDQGYFVQVHQSERRETVDFSVDHLTNGNYKLEIFRVGFEKADPFTRYLMMGRPANPSLTEETLLRSAATCEPVVTTQQVRNGSFAKRFELRDNDIVLIKLTKLTK